MVLFRGSGDGQTVVMTDDTLHLNGTLGSTKRSGLWQVPRYVSIKRRLGSVELDFSQAEFVDDAVDILVDLVGGSLEIRVPADVWVESSVTTNLGSYEDHRKGNPDDPRIMMRLSGSTTAGSVQVRGPKKAIWPFGAKQ